MVSMRKRKQFNAQILTATGRPVTECFVIADIETEVAGQTRSVRWSGKITSLSAPQHALAGSYRLRPDGTEQASRRTPEFAAVSPYWAGLSWTRNVLAAGASSALAPRVQLMKPLTPGPKAVGTSAAAILALPSSVTY